MKETILPIVLLLCLSLVASLLAPLTVSAQTEFRFPRPEFSSGYQHEEMYLPAARLTPPGLDLFLLVFLLGVTAWAVLRRRSRNWVLALSLVSLVYFGFYRQGCVCSVGSVQNVLNAFIGTGEVLTLTVALFFLIPLVTAL
ncbi:MAG TPA: hypothetical protein PLC40_11340, partial [Candidatus Hydrogenedentes bacterium]|nr:hypothetical protein [Candidatus Hydrogenedentota bacterium]